MKKYSYSAEDNSLLTPFIYRFFVNPLMAVLPKSIPANIITLVSNTFIITAFIIAYVNYVQGTSKFLWLIPILCFAYIIGDYSDGIQARRTKTSSALGEYFDHFLDSFVTGLLTGIIMLTFRVKNPILLFCTYQFLYLGQIGSFWERLHNGVMRFGKISTSEGVMAIAFMTSLYPTQFIQDANNNIVFWGFSVTDHIIFIGFLASGISGFFSILSTKKCSLRLLLHIIFSAYIAITLIYFENTSILILTIIVMFYNVFFIESLLKATDQKTKESFPDFITPLICSFYFLLPQYIFELQILQILYLALRIIINFALFFYSHRKYWYWINS